MKELRKVIYTYEKKSKHGCFHMWIKYADKQVYALVETEEGFMIELHNREIKFIK